MRRSLSGIVSVVLVCCSVLAVPASGSVLEIQFSGMDLAYNGTNVYDAGVANTVGMGKPSDADSLLTMIFLVDGVQQGMLTTNIGIDTCVKGLSGIPAAGGSAMTAGNGDSFGVDLLTKATTPGWGLALNIDKLNFFYTGSNIAIAAGGPGTSIWSQDLPFGLAFDPSQPISVVMSSANLTNVTTAGGYLTGFHAAGTGNISGTLLPEPTTMLLVALGGLGLLRRRSR